METTVDEAKNLLQNGILVETNKGLICMSLNDALSSNLNLSVEDLQNVATKLIMEQKPKIKLGSSNFNFDSDGFSSECSDISIASSSMKAETLKPPQTFTPVVTKLHKAIKIDHNENGPQLIEPNPVDMEIVHKPPKRRGGWPKGRKRKPELLNLPPKAPATGYNLYLNEQRKFFKNSSLAFHEITKIVGNNWSSLSLEEKRPYLERAEEDKRRYREELKQYRQSDAYRAYLARKRINRMQNNILSESDMDATDEIDEEDNEELYCRTCDQWFHNLHNKKEHLQGKQHTQSVAGDIRKELNTHLASSTETSTISLNESLLELSSTNKTNKKKDNNGSSVNDCMANLVAVVLNRENEIELLKKRLVETKAIHNNLCKELAAFRQKYTKLKNDLIHLKKHEKNMETKVSQLWQVPSWFIMDLNTTTETETETTDINDASE